MPRRKTDAQRVAGRVAALLADAARLEQGDGPRALALADEAARIAASGGLPAGEAHARLLAGRLRILRKMCPEALSDLQSALRLSRVAGLPEVEADALLNLGSVFSMISRNRQAVSFYIRADRMMGRLPGPPARRMNARLAVIQGLMRLGKTVTALRLARAARRAAARGTPENKAMTRRLLAMALRHAGRWRESLAEAAGAHAAFRRLGNRARTAEMASAAAELHAHLGEPARARPLFLEALELARQEALDVLVCDAQYGLGELALRSGGFAEAEQRFAAVRTTARRARLPYNEIVARAGLAQLAAARGDPAGARRTLERLAAQAAAIQEPALSADILTIRKSLTAPAAAG